jgi:hypothetical protein
MLIEKCKKNKLPALTQLMAKLLEREMKSAGFMKRGPIVKRDNYQLTELIFLLLYLLLKNSEFCPKQQSFS